jgi:hypothetical protein
MDEPARLFGDVFMGAERLAERGSQALAPGWIEMSGAFKTRLRGLCQSDDGLSNSE